MAVRIQLRRDTSANWISSNPVLREGEMGIETDTLKIKLGDGTSTWTQISGYMNLVPDGNLTIGDYVMVNDIGAAEGVVGLDINKNAIVTGSSIILEGSTNNAYETTLTVTDPTADRTITFKNADGTVAFVADIPTTTDALTEGSTNKYFTDERAQDAAAAALAAGSHTNITVTYNDAANSLSLAAAPGYVDEQAVDAVAAALAAGTHTNISVSYDDAGNSISLTGAQTYNDEMARDAIGAALTAGAGVSVTPNDGADTITIANTGVTSITGTTNEVEVSASTGSVTVGLPDNIAITGKITSVDSIQIDKTAAITPAEGELSWDANDGTLQLGLISGNYATHIGRDIVLRVFNAESSTIPKGSVVYLYGAQGDRPSVKLASNSSEITSSKTLGIAAEAISSSSDGLIVTQGMISGLSLAAYTPGDVLWLGSTPGSFTSTKPSAPSHMVFVGIVAKANNGNGMAYIKPQNGYELEELHNVQISSVANNDVLKYDSTSSTWKNTNDLNLNSLTVTNLTVSGTTTTVNSTDLAISDPLIYIGTGNSANANDLGIVGHFDNGTYQHTGIVRDATDGKWKLFSGVTTEPGTTIDFTGATYDTLKAGAFEGNLTGNVTGNLTGDVTGNVSGNAGTVTNGVYTTATYSNPSWITGLAWSKISSTPTTVSGYGISDAVSTGGTYSNPSWLTGLAWSKVSSTPTTLSGYGITDALSSSTAASTYAPIASPTFTGTVSGITKSMVGLGNVENTALSTWAGSSSVTTLGTVATGTWSATTIATNKGGTGLTSYATGDILYASATDTLAKLTAGTNGQILTLSSGVPTWAAAPITLPTQTGNSGKYLTTDGSTASWASLVVPITTATSTLTANTATSIDAFSATAGLAIEYMVTLKQGTKMRTSKVLLHCDGTAVDITEYSIMELNGTMSGVAITGSINGSAAYLNATVTDAATTNVTVKLSKVAL